MRPIIFKGKRKDNGEWVYGSYVYRHDNPGLLSVGKTFADYEHHYIVVQVNHDWGLTEEVRYEVIPETVGQFSGLPDKNGKEIYEGDFVILNGETTLYLDETTIKGQEVLYENGAFWCAWSDGIDTYGGDALLADIQTKNIEIIGNIHEGEE